MSSSESVEQRSHNEDVNTTTVERHPLEAHLMALEMEESARPPTYSTSKLVPDLNFSADSLRQDSIALARVLVSFIAYAVRTFGTIGTAELAAFSRFEKWQDRPVDADRFPATILNERNLVYREALKIAKDDVTERGLWVRKFALREEKKKNKIMAEWVIEFSGAHKRQVSHTDVFEHHRERHNRATPTHSPAHSRATSIAPRHVSQMSNGPQGWYGDEPPLTSTYLASPTFSNAPLSPPPMPSRPAPRPHPTGVPHPQYPHHFSVGQLRETPLPRRSEPEVDANPMGESGGCKVM